MTQIPTEGWIMILRSGSIGYIFFSVSIYMTCMNLNYSLTVNHCSESSCHVFDALILNLYILVLRAKSRQKKGDDGYRSWTEESEKI